MTSYKHIAIEGNIGAGKTTLAASIAEWAGLKPVFEEHEKNPFLQPFYEKSIGSTFALETRFMIDRYKLLIKHNKGNIVSDFFFEKSLVFSGVNINGAEQKLFSELYGLLSPSLSRPDIIIFLLPRVNVLLKNIHRRGRKSEDQISANYLQKIDQSYKSVLEQIKGTPVLILKDYEPENSAIEKIKILLNKSWPEGIIQVRDWEN